MRKVKIGKPRQVKDFGNRNKFKCRKSIASILAPGRADDREDNARLDWTISTRDNIKSSRAIPIAEEHKLKRLRLRGNNDKPGCK